MGSSSEKKIHEQHKQDFIPEWKSRLVGCGDFENAARVRTDAPTSDLKTHSIVAAFAASIGVPIQSSDIKDVYCHRQYLLIGLLRSRTTRSGHSAFCGKQLDREDKDVLIDVADNTTRTTHINIGKNRKAEEKITPGEEKQLRSGSKYSDPSGR